VVFSGVVRYAGLVGHPNTAPNIELDTTPTAPGELELVRAFLSLHDHAPGTKDSLPPSTATIGWWLRDRELLDPEATASEADLTWAAGVLEALRARVFENMGEPSDPGAVRTLDEATALAGLVPRFGADGLVPTADGVRGAVGQVLAVAFLAQLDGSWKRFRECGAPDCRSVFYDRSKNHTGRWCVMAECGNRAKVRAYRERARATS
jgi:predicted RNA-binding Zn ribbon-like protein